MSLEPRASYAQAGRAMRATLTRAHALKLPVRDLRVVNAVLILTSSWSKLADSTTTREVAELAYGRDVAGWERKKVWESLTKLDALGVFAVTRVGKGRGARLRVQLLTVADQETSPRPGDVHPQECPPIPRTMSPHVAAHREVPRISSREATKKSAAKHHKLDELVARLTDELTSVGARVPRSDELEHAVAHALTVVDWRVVDVAIGRAAEKGHSWAYFKTALTNVRAG